MKLLPWQSEVEKSLFHFLLSDNSSKIETLTYNCQRFINFVIMVNFDNFDLNYADSDAFWEFSSILDIVPVLACFCRDIRILLNSYIY